MTKKARLRHDPDQLMTGIFGKGRVPFVDAHRKRVEQLARVRVCILSSVRSVLTARYAATLQQALHLAAELSLEAELRRCPLSVKTRTSGALPAPAIRDL